jgi:hypothetical protein
MLFGQILYEEHFTGGAMQLGWHPWFAYSGYTDSMQVISDPTTPEGDGWAGKITNESGGTAGATYSGTADLDDYSIESWIITTVTAGAGGPYNGIMMRMDTTTHYYYRLVSDFDSDGRLRLGAFTGGMGAVVLRDWPSGEIPGGVPTTSSWHKLKMKMIADSIWCWYDDVMMTGCPIMDTAFATTQGFFGVYVFNMAATDSTKCDGIVVAGPVGITEYGSQELNTLKVCPNPFRHTLNIRYTIHDTGYMIKESTIRICDAAGRVVRAFRITPDALRSTLSWDGRDASGNELAPGVYFITDELNSQMVKVVRVR